MATGTNSTHPPILSTIPTRPSRPVPPLKKPTKPSLFDAAMRRKATKRN